MSPRLCDVACVVHGTLCCTTIPQHSSFPGQRAAKMCDFFVDDLDVGAVRKPVQWVAVAPPLVVRHKQKCACRAALRVVYERHMSVSRAAACGSALRYWRGCAPSSK